MTIQITADSIDVNAHPNIFKPFTYHNDMIGGQPEYKQFVENVHNISGGIALMLQIVVRSNSDFDCGITPYLSDYQKDKILQAAISINDLIGEKAESLIEWQNGLNEAKEGNNHA